MLLSSADLYGTEQRALVKYPAAITERISDYRRGEL